MMIDSVVAVVENRFILQPEFMIKFSEAISSVQSYWNTAYVYCGFNQWLNNVSVLFDYKQAAVIGRTIIRVLTAMANDFFYRTNCVIDGILGQYYYDIGFCSGKMI